MSYSIEYHLWGLWPVGYHVINVLLHIANSILVFILIKALLDSKFLIFNFKSISNFRSAIALLTSLFFLIHPIQTEAVAYVAGRTDLLPAAFMLAGLIIFIKFIKFIKFIPLFFILALLSKETAIIFPLLLFITDWLLFSHSLTKTARIHLRLWIRLAAIAMVYIFLRLTVFNFQNTLNFYGGDNIYTTNILYRLFTFFHALTVYGQLLIAPVNLYMERSLPLATSLFSLPVVIGFVVFLMAFYYIYRTYAKTVILFGITGNSYIAYGLLWFFIAILPSSNILIPINNMLAEHFLYFPCIGLFFIVALILVRGYLIVPNLFRHLLLFSLICLFSFYIFRSFERNRDWHDPITFYNQTLNFVSGSARVRNNLAMNYADLGNHEQAIKHYRLAIATQDTYPQTHYNLANSLLQLGKTADAIVEYEKAIQMQPSFLPAYPVLINIYKARNDIYNRDRIINQLRLFGVSP